MKTCLEIWWKHGTSKEYRTFSSFLLSFLSLSFIAENNLQLLINNQCHPTAAWCSSAFLFDP